MNPREEVLEKLRKIIEKNSNLQTEFLSLEIIAFLKDLFLTSNALFLCESGLSYPALAGIYSFLEKWEKEILYGLGEKEIRATKGVSFFCFEEKTLH